MRALPPAQLLPFDATSADVQLLTGLYVLRGWSVLETTGAAAASLLLRDGASTTAPVVASASLAQGTTSTSTTGTGGLLLRTGLYLDVTAGSVSGTVWYNAVTIIDGIAIVAGDEGGYIFEPGT